MLGVGVQLVEAGDLVIDLVHELGKGHPEDGAGVRKANARINVLGDRCRIIGQTEGDGSGDQGGQNAKDHIAGGVIDHGAGQHEAPVVPDINVQGAGEADYDQQDIQGKHADEDQRRNGYGPRKGTGDGPADVDDVQTQIELFYQAGGDGANVLGQQVHDHEGADKAAANGNGGFQELFQRNADHQTDDEHENGHHTGGTEVLHKADNTLDSLHTVSPLLITVLNANVLGRFSRQGKGGGQSSSFWIMSYRSSRVLSRPTPVKMLMPS